MSNTILSVNMSRFDNKYYLFIMLESNGAYKGIYDINTEKWIKLLKISNPTFETEEELISKVELDLKFIENLVNGSI